MPEQAIIRHGKVEQDNWQVVEQDATALPAGEQLILPCNLWQQLGESLKNRTDIGVWFDSAELPTVEQAAALQSLPIIAVNFPVFTDGRGFSIARLLRERFAYRGELRAIGYVLRDQLCFLKRCGFDSFVLPVGVNPEVALTSLNDFTEYYQTSVDQPQPLFRRI